MQQKFPHLAQPITLGKLRLRKPHLLRPQQLPQHYPRGLHHRAGHALV